MQSLCYPVPRSTAIDFQLDHQVKGGRRKAVLIKPVMVNSGGALNDDVPGTIYIGTNIVDLKVAKKKRDS